MKNRVKILLITMLTALYCCGTVVPVSAETFGGKCGKNVSWSYDEETKALTISGSGDMYNYYMDINGKRSNLPPWNDKQFSKLVIEDGVTSVGAYAFNMMNEKVDIAIPISVKKIGEYAFSGLKNGSFVIPNGVELIGEGAFSGSSLREITIPPSVKYVGADAFFDCDVEKVYITDLAAWCRIDFATIFSNPMYRYVSPVADSNEEDNSLRSLYVNDEFVSILDMPDGIEKIGKYAFAGCESILIVNFSKSVKDIGERAFYSCNNMFGVYISDEVETIGAYAFASCPKLEVLIWEAVETGNSNLKTIGDSAFENCPISENVTIPAGVERVGMRAFAENENLKSLTISENVGVIGESAFENCDYLETVTISSGLKKIEKNAFYGDVRQKVYIDDLSAWCSIDFGNEYSNPLSNTWWYDGLYLNNELVEKLVIPEGVTSVGRYAFYGAKCIKEIELPENIQNIGGYAFHNTEFFNNSENWEDFDTAGYVDLNYDFLYIGDCLIATTFGAIVPTSGVFEDSENGLLSEYNEICTQFKPGTRIIGGAAFANCDGLTNVIIPESVERICDSAFENCEMLKEVEIPDTVEIDTERMFSGCKKLESVNIPNGVEKIGNEMFFRCETLRDVTIPSTVKEIGDDAFCYCFDLEDIELPSGLTSIGAGAFKYTALYSINIPNGVEKIGNEMFFRCETLRDVTIPSTVKEIGDYAFCYCFDLEDIKLPSGLTSIGAGAFKYTALYSINIPGGVKEIGESAFLYSMLEGEVIINDGVEKIGEYAFMNTILTSITIPASVKYIGEYAFSNCQSLKYVMIPEGVEIIEDYAFDECAALTEVYVPKSITYIGENAFGGSEYVMSKLYYTGSETDWKSVFVGEDCAAEDAEVIYNFKGVRAYTFDDDFDAKLNVVAYGIDKGATVIFAKYDEKKFLGMESKVYDGKMLRFDNDYSEGKIMVWGDLENITPITSVTPITPITPAYDVKYLEY